jgi:hypothetical protein
MLLFAREFGRLHGWFASMVGLPAQTQKKAQTTDSVKLHFQACNPPGHGHAIARCLAMSGVTGRIQLMVGERDVT